MALTYHIHPERSLVVVTRTHRVGSEEWEAFLDQQIQDPALEPGFGLLDDRRAVSDTPTRRDVERAARWIQDHADKLGPMRWAIVVAASSPAAFGMARVGEALTSRTPVTVRAFIDYDTAFAWAQQKSDEV